MLDIPSLDYFEGMTSISAVINSIKSGTSNRRILRILYDRSRTKQKTHELRFLEANSHNLGYTLEAVDSDYIDQLTSGNTHGGFVAECTQRTFLDLNVNFLTNGDFYVLLEGVEDPYNFGYSVRSLYAAGVDGIILPPRNWMEFSNTVARSSAGTSELAQIYIADPLDAVEIFKKRGFEIACAGIRDSISIYDHDYNKPILLIVGGEKRGISRKILDASDITLRIDYGREFMGSLPSASAISIMAFEIARKKNKLQI